MGLRQLKWLTVIIPVVVIVVYDYYRHIVYPQILHQWPGGLLFVALGAIGLSQFVFGTVGRREALILRRVEEISALNSLASNLARSLALSEVLETALNFTLELAKAGVGAIYLVPEGDIGLDLRTERGGFAVLVSSLLRNYDGNSPIGDAAKHGEPVVMEKLEGDRQSLICFPLKSHERTVGVLAMVVPDQDSQITHNLDFIAAIGHQIGVAIDNANLYQQSQSVAILEERDRIAKELHDSMAQVLGYLHLKARTAEQLLATAQNERVVSALQEMAKVADDAYVDVREAILGLRSPTSPPQGLLRAIGAYLEMFSAQSGLETKLIVAPDAATEFPPAVEVQLIRVIQEALTNIRKHSSAKSAWVRFECEDRLAKISVEDDGQGFDPRLAGDQRGDHFGLTTMRERSESIGGSFTLKTAPGSRTTVTVRLPLGPYALNGQKRGNRHDEGSTG